MSQNNRHSYKSDPYRAARKPPSPGKNIAIFSYLHCLKIHK